MSLLKDKALRLNLISMLILIITVIYDCMFRGGEKLFRIGLMAITLWIMYGVYKKTFLRKTRISFYLIYSFIFGAMYLGNVFDFYLIIPMYDKILHLMSGLILGMIGYILFVHVSNGATEGSFKRYMPILFSIIFSIAGAAVWEIWEFSTDQLFGFASQNNSLHDTMWDIICGSLMGGIANIPIYLYYIKGKKIKFIESLNKEIKEY
ncbi:hypothetical protein [Clostridium sp. D53t1_180928_C8]|uniref:hypothetical protein n=1 Tax=Clostridium sp. D53t1_180928_C8 TaxID=2787101 RepID=UPI0018A9D37B|nr:hypothetical protein [Clostridium sp. D53t1_180928_C8]